MSDEVIWDAKPDRLAHRRSIALGILGCVAFIVLFALLYGSTMSASPRNGVQPVEFADEAFYAVLSRDLSRTGTETAYSTSGFAEIVGVPAQTWYHWGELWLTAAAIRIFGADPLAARNLIVLPVLLLAAAALSGTIVRRLAGTPSRKAFVWGFVACVLLSSTPLVVGPYFSYWGRGMAFGITLYGLAAVAVLMALYCLVIQSSRRTGWDLSIFVGTATVLIVPAHLVLGLLAVVGAATTSVIRVSRSVRITRRLPTVPVGLKRTLLAIAIVGIATVAWGLVTGHGTLATAGSPTVLPFNSTWRDSVLLTVLWSGVFLAIPVAWLVVRTDASLRSDLLLSTMVVLFVGAAVWGARLSEFTMFYFFYAGVTVIAIPMAALAVWILGDRLRKTGHRTLRLVLAATCAIQLELSVVPVLAGLQQFGPGTFPAPISVSLLDAIRALPADAELAYACSTFDEVGFAGSRMLGIDAHTDRRVVPMCYEAEFVSALVGATLSPNVPNAFFKWAPQEALYPSPEAHPTSDEVASFLKSNGIHYIYADPQHPNTLVTFAVPIAASGGGEVLWIP
jgi:hypothetical protein